jgi:hypothetical protein
VKQTVKVAKSNRARQRLMAFIVVGVAIAGAAFIVLSHAVTSYNNPYSCSTHPILSTSTRTSQSTCTKYVQYILNSSNSPSPNLTIDGDYYTATKTAVQHFQFDKKVSNSGCGTTYSSCDGIVGSATWTKLDSENARLTQLANMKGSVACSSANSTSITLGVSWSSTSGTTVLLRGSTQIASWTGSSGSTSKVDAGLAPSTGYNYYLKNGTTTLASIGCRTTAKPTGSLGCGATTTSSVALNITYNNGDGATGLYRGTTLLVSYAKGAATTSRTDTGLAANTSYAYSLKSGSTLLVSVTCKTAAAPTTTTTSPPPTTTTTPPPTSGGSTTPTSPGGTVVVNQSSPLSSSAVTKSSGSTSSSTGVDVVSGETPSDATSDVVDGVTVDGSSDSSVDTNDSNSPTSVANIQAKSSSTLKTVMSAFAVVALMVIGFFAWLIIRSRRLDAEQTYDYSTDYNYAAPVSQDVYAVPSAPSQPPVSNTKLEEIVNSTFYPGQLQQPAPATPEPKADEPLDMFDIANQYPTSFGNSHNILTQQPTGVFKPVEPASTPPADPADLIPLPPAPTEPTSGDLTIQH